MNIDKVFSGRLWLTIITGLVFAYCSVSKQLTPDVIATITTAVFLSYFQRSDRNGKGGSSDGQSNGVASK